MISGLRQAGRILLEGDLIVADIVTDEYTASLTDPLTSEPGESVLTVDLAEEHYVDITPDTIVPVEVC